jgi:hypothetical protein
MRHERTKAAVDTSRLHGAALDAACATQDLVSQILMGLPRATPIRPRQVWPWPFIARPAIHEIVTTQEPQLTVVDMETRAVVA